MVTSARESGIPSGMMPNPLSILKGVFERDKLHIVEIMSEDIMFGLGIEMVTLVD